MLEGPEVSIAPAATPLAREFARDVRRGLARSPKTLPSKYFYDERGSRLFQKITEQPEYYLTRCEREILQRYAPDITGALGSGACELVEIGAGDGHKTEALLTQLAIGGRTVDYIPVDICRQSVIELTRKLHTEFDGSSVTVRGIVAEYFDAFRMLRRTGGPRRLTLFLGSSIGNFGDRQARRFLRALRRSQRAGDLTMIGFDLKKDLGVLQRAYDDAAGVTREFNFNLLARINRELEGNFDRRCFAHHAAYNLRLGAMESFLVSTERQQIAIRRLEASVSLAAWEGIRVERSYKYDFDKIEAFAAASGFAVRNHFLDGRRYFADSLWEAI